LPDRYWDAATKAVKHADLLKDYNETTAKHNELAAWKAAEDSRRLTTPKPADYEDRLPDNYEYPSGFKKEELNFNPENPVLKQIKDWAHSKGLSREDYREMLGFHAADEIQRMQAMKAGFEAEKTKLGGAAQARMDTVNNFVKATAPNHAKALLDGLWTAAQVQAIEEIMDRFRTQGAGSYSTTGSQAAPSSGQIDGYDKMSFAQRRAAQDAMRNRQAGGSGR
jgi:hypothetical protein